jgi:hypothetical protein
MAQDSGANVYAHRLGLGAGLTDFALDATATVFASEDTAYSGTSVTGQKGNGATVHIKNNSTTINTVSQIVFEHRSTGNCFSRIASVVTDSNGNETSLVFGTESAGNVSEKMRISDAGFVGIGTSTPNAHLKVEDTSIDTAAEYNGIFAQHEKTAGATNASHNIMGLKSMMTFNDGDAFYDNLFGSRVNAYSQASAGESTAIYGSYAEARMAGSTDVNNIWGSYVLAQVDAGTVDQIVYGQYIDIDIESGCSIGDHVLGHFINMDIDQNPTGNVYGIQLNMDGYGGMDEKFLRFYDVINSTDRVLIGQDGQIDAEGTINQSQYLDYAEYFESKSGSAIAIGSTVKLDGDKIVACEEGDTPIGVVRPVGSSSIVGGGQIFHWQEKYKKDDYGADVWESFTKTKWSEEITFEEYSARGKDETGGAMSGNVKDSKVEGSKAKDAVLDDEGNELEPAVDAVPDTYFREHKYHSDRLPEGVTAPDDAEVIEMGQRQKLNPDYDESKTYVPREDRDEWHIVGLLGQIPVTKGQPTGTWIKMKDVSDTVEMYFVK